MVSPSHERETMRLLWVFAPIIYFGTVSIQKCVFHSKAATDYTAKLPPISHECCHPLHGKAATPEEVDSRRV